MQTVNLTQGTAEWHAHRSTHFNASDAAAMMGQSTYESRSALIHRLKTGITPEISPFTQRLFDQGHRFEALARTHIAQHIIGEELYPCVGVAGQLSASFDGLTMDESLCFEHKALNDKLRKCTSIAELPMAYKIQMQQQLMVASAQKCLFVASEWDDDDTLLDKRVFWYASDLGLAQQIADGWLQLARDIAACIPVEAAAIAQTTEIMPLPRLSFEVTGQVTASNLAAYQVAAEAFIASIHTDLSTDDDFAQAEKTVKFCKETEDKLEQAKDAALSRTASIDALFRTIDYLSEAVRSKRLLLTGLIKSQKETIKTNLILQAQQAFNQYVYDLNAQLTGAILPALTVKFAEAIKGKKTLTSMQNALSDELARLKIEADATARTIRSNLAHLDQWADYRYLFHDLQMIAVKDCDDFASLVRLRIDAHKAAQAMQAEQAQKTSTPTNTVQAQAVARPSKGLAPQTHMVDLREVQLPAHLQNELRELIVFAQAHGYTADTTKLEYLVGGLPQSTDKNDIEQLNGCASDGVDGATD